MAHPRDTGAVLFSREWSYIHELRTRDHVEGLLGKLFGHESRKL